MTEQIDTIETIHKTNSTRGLCVLKAQPTVWIPTVENGTMPWSQVPFEKIIQILNGFLSNLYQASITTAKYKLSNRVPQGTIAWICKSKPEWALYPTAIESRGLMLKHILFIETQNLEKSLHKVLQQELFKAVVVIGPESRTVTQMARQWLKPKDSAKIYRAQELQETDSEKLFIYAQEETTALRRSRYLLNC